MRSADIISRLVQENAEDVDPSQYDGDRRLDYQDSDAVPFIVIGPRCYYMEYYPELPSRRLSKTHADVQHEHLTDSYFAKFFSVDGSKPEHDELTRWEPATSVSGRLWRDSYVCAFWGSVANVISVWATVQGFIKHLGLPPQDFLYGAGQMAKYVPPRDFLQLGHVKDDPDAYALHLDQMAKRRLADRSPEAQGSMVAAEQAKSAGAPSTAQYNFQRTAESIISQVFD